MTDCPPGSHTINLKTGKPVVNSSSDDIAARAFSVFDAAFQVSLEGLCLWLDDGLVLPPFPITVIFPGPSSYDETDNVVRIARADALDWDVVYHEYFHYFSRECAFTDFNTGPGGTHDGSSAIPTHGKDKGMRLAWDEAIATVMAILAQLEGRAGTVLGIPKPPMPGTGDRHFGDSEGNTWSWDLETDGQTLHYSDGYGSELSIIGALYDLWDTDKDNCGWQEALCTDHLSLKFHDIWSLFNTGAWDDVGKFYNYVSGLLLGADPNLQPLFSNLFVMNHIAPLAYAPAHNSMHSTTRPPTFSWIAHGDSTPGYENEEFTLCIFKNGLNPGKLVFTKSNLTTTSWTPTKAEWQTITRDASSTPRYDWYVMGWNKKTFRTPPVGTGYGAFTSNMQSFQINPSIYAHGMMGCPNKSAALFFNGFPLEVDVSSSRYPFHGSAAGTDYDGDSIYFRLNGEFFLEQSKVVVDIEMYQDPGYSVHIRTDHAEAYAWNEYFYDLECDLTRDTSAGCVPIWFAVRFTADKNPAAPETPDVIRQSWDTDKADKTVSTLGLSD